MKRRTFFERIGLGAVGAALVKKSEEKKVDREPKGAWSKLNGRSILGDQQVRIYRSGPYMNISKILIQIWDPPWQGKGGLGLEDLMTMHVNRSSVVWTSVDKDGMRLDNDGRNYYVKCYISAVTIDQINEIELVPI